MQQDKEVQLFLQQHRVCHLSGKLPSAFSSLLTMQAEQLFPSILSLAHVSFHVFGPMEGILNFLHVFFFPSGNLFHSLWLKEYLVYKPFMIVVPVLSEENDSTDE